MKLNKIVVIFLIIIIPLLKSEEKSHSKFDQPIKVFYDGGGSFFNFLRNDINFVHFVRDPTIAEVHLQINSLPTGDGGREYTFFFKGLNGFKNLDDTLKTTVSGFSTVTQREEQLAKFIKLGLIRYVSKTPYAELININYSGEIPTISQKDIWNSWIFGIGFNSFFKGEESKKDFYWEADLDIDRITEESKIRINGKYSNELKEFYDNDVKSTSSKKSTQLDLLYVKSISDHFSAGAYTEIKSKTYENIQTGFSFEPAVEYNYFPYSESLRKNFTFLYKIGYTNNNYFEETIYQKKNENLYKQSLTVNYELHEIWGDADFNLEGSNYLHDFKKNRVEFRTRFSFRLAGSFYFNIRADLSYVNDQLYLPVGEATLEEILLNQKKLSSQYEYSLRFGVSYTFGSIYNSVVNTRF